MTAVGQWRRPLRARTRHLWLRGVGEHASGLVSICGGWGAEENWVHPDEPARPKCKACLAAQVRTEANR